MEMPEGCGWKKESIMWFSVSPNPGTHVGSNHKIKLWKLLLFGNHFRSRHLWDHETVWSSLKMWREATVNCRSFCSEVTDYLSQNQEAIDGSLCFCG